MTQKVKRKLIPTSTHEIVYRDVTIEVTGFYEKPVMQTREYPGDPQGFEIHEVKHCGVEIREFFDDLQFEEMEEIVLGAFYE